MIFLPIVGDTPTVSLTMSQQQNDNSLDMLWMMALILGAIIVLKIWLGDEIIWFYVQLRMMWLKVITFVWEKENLMQAKNYVLSRKTTELNAKQLSELSNMLRFFMFPFWAGLVGWVGWNVIKKNPGRRFRRKLTRKDLAFEMSGEFPWSLPALQQDLLKASIHEGTWSMAKNPLNFSLEYGLLEGGKTLNKGRADSLFASQLGNLWSGPERLNKYSRAIFGCLIAQVCRDKEGSIEALKELVVSISAKKPVFTKSDALVKKYKDDPRVLAICERHAYQYTVLAALFEQGKEIGICPPNHMLWLKPINRRLWFVLDCVLRRTFFAEVAGVYAHFLAEKIAGHKIEMPYTQKATLALEIALRDVLLDPVKNEERSRELAAKREKAEAERQEKDKQKKLPPAKSSGKK